MKILKNNYLKEQNDKVVCTCEYCNSKLEFDKNELEVGEFGLYKFTCPCCNRINILDDGIELNEDNLEYPKHFSNFDSGREIDDNEINEWIKKCIRHVKEKDEYSLISSGNTIVIATPYDDGCDKYINVIVAKNHQSVDIDFD